MAINKDTEYNNTRTYPSNRFNNRERKLLQVTEGYEPAEDSDWSDLGVSVPSRQDSALDSLASALSGSQNLKIANALWDFSVDGGAISDIDLGIDIPDDAIIFAVLRDVQVAPTSSDDLGEIVLNLPTDGDLDSAVVADGAGAGISYITSSTLPLKATAARDLQVSITNTALTAGRIRYQVFYVISE